jgi:hypothetical protein
VAGGDLHVTQRHASIQGHDERGSQHVRVHQTKPGTLPDRTNPAVCSAPIEALAVAAAQDGALAALPDGQVEGPCGARHEGDDRGLAALAEDPQRAVAALDAEVLDVGGAGLRDSKAVQAEQDRQGGVVVVMALGGEEEPAEFGAIQAATLGGMNLGPTDVLRRVRRDAAVDVCEAVEPADRREAPVDGRRGQTALLQPVPVQLDVRSGRGKDLEADRGGPLKVAAQVVAICVERTAAVASQKGCRGELGWINGVVASGVWIIMDVVSVFVMADPPGHGRISQPSSRPAATQRRVGPWLGWAL